MKVDDKTSEILGRNFELSIDDAERLYNIGNFEKFSYSKIMSRAGQDLLLETAKTPVKLLGAVGQIPYAVETGAKFIRDRLPSSIKTDGNVIFGGKTAVDIMGKAKSVGDTLMEVSSRTLDEINKQAEKVLPKLSPEEQESAFNTYAQVGTQLSALLGLSMMSPKAGLDYITALTLGGETEEGFETYKAKNKGSMEGYGEQAGKDLFANLANTAIQRKIEGLIGIPGKMKFFRSAKELGRAGLYAGATGWLEEGTQGLTDAIIDDFNGRLEGQVDKDGKPLTWWTKWLSQVQEINAAAVVQGAMGVGFALNNRASVKNEIKSIVEKHVEPEKVNEVVNTVYDSMDLSIKNVVAKELEMSSSLQTKRGEVYESLYKAALEQVKVAKEQGGFPELQTEEDIANYVKSVADGFADETLAEAHRRNTVIEEVLDPSLIRYENGQLVMPMTKGVTFDSTKVREAEEQLKVQIENNATNEEKEENLNYVVSSYEGSENFDVKDMSIEDKQEIFEAKQEQDEMAKVFFSDEQLEKGELFPETTDLGVKQTEHNQAEYDERLRQAWLDDESDDGWRKMSELEEEYQNIFGEEALDNLRDTFDEEQATIKGDEDRVAKYKEWQKSQESLTQESVEDYDPEKQYNEYDIVKRKINGEDKYVAYIDDSWNVYESLDEAKNQVEAIRNIVEHRKQYDNEVKAKQESDFEKQREALVYGNGDVTISHIVDALKSEGLWEHIPAKTRGNILAFSDYLITFKDNEMVEYRLADSSYGQRVKKGKKLAYGSIQAIVNLRNKLKSVEDYKEELSSETNEAIQEDSLPEVEKEDTVTKGGKIEDFGEKIEGARKDLWQNYLSKIESEMPASAEDIKLSEVFPEPNYEKAIANGISVDALATIKALRDLIPTKPKSVYKLFRWAATVKSMREIAQNIINSNFSMDTINDILSNPLFKDIRGQVELYRTLGYPYFRNAKGYSIRGALVTQRGEERYPGGKPMFEVRYNNRTVRINGNYYLDSFQEAIDGIKSLLDAPKSDKKVKFDLYSRGGSSEIILGKKVGSGKYLDLHTFETVAEARAYLVDNYDSLVKELEDRKQQPIDRGEVNRARIGDDYRKGKNVSPEEFSDMFGFRGVQFGNWVEQKTRVADLNQAYDALVDLSKILNIPTQAISLNGTLGLAFGARGRKGAAAHYEPDQVVINLTKMQGAGSLAHEWFHALDNGFLRKEDQRYWERYTTETSRSLLIQNNRIEVITAFMNLGSVLSKSELSKRSFEFDKARTNNYWSTIRELGARTFEQYIKDKAKSLGVENDFLVNIVVAEGQDENVYLNENEKAEIYDAFDKLFNTLQTRKTEKGVELYQKSIDIANQNAELDKVNPAYEGETININGVEHTVYNSNGDRIAMSEPALRNFYNWFGDSKVVDEQGRPLVVYHGSHADFEEFSKEYIGKGRGKIWGDGFYFTSSREHAEVIATGFFGGREAYLYPVYLKIENPLVDGKMGYIPDEYDGRIQHGAGLNKQEHYYVVKEPNQVKATDNKGYYSESDNMYKQGEKGSIQFKGDRALITLTEEANSSTLAHELAHYWLQNTFLYSKSGLATPEYKQFFNSIAKYLDITDDQETIKEWQQEKWARAAEMYAMGKAPEGMEKPLTQYQQWIRKAYGEVSEPMYIDENGEAKVPEFDFETMKMFANLAGETLTEPEFKQKQEAVRGLAKSTNQMAQAKGMKTELPTYEKRSATDMGKKADEFIQRDKQLAIDIVKGLKPEQEGLFRQDLFSALRELALNEGDSDLLNELSKSMTVEEATELGQRIQALARGRIDPVKQMVELRDERMKKNKVDKKKLKEETEKAKKEIKKEMAEASTPKEWADFIKSLEC